MVIVRISSGLGNQMFQYALCRVLMENAVTVKADTSVFAKKKERRPYELENIFGIKVVAASSFEVGMMNAVSKISYKLFGNPYKEQHEAFGVYEPAITKMTTGYINGFWQSEKYFLHIQDKIRDVFNFPAPTDIHNTETLQQVRSLHSVSIHIRRTDYVNEFNWGLTTAYYKEAIDIIKNRVAEPHFYFFSDDIEWVKEKFKGSNFHYIDFNTGENSFRDMQLMSNCKHHIIANSTFSWWGAWLNPSKDKIVIAPDKWLPHIPGTRDIIPESWMQIPVSLGG